MKVDGIKGRDSRNLGLERFEKSDASRRCERC